MRPRRLAGAARARADRGHIFFVRMFAPLLDDLSHILDKVANRVALRRNVASGALAAAGLFLPAAVIAAPVIAPGTPTTSVPTYLSDGSYLFGIAVALGPDQFLLPVESTGATDLQNWDFNLSFDNTVVREADPGDGTSGIYGARFTPDDADSLSFILSGFPFNARGRVEAVAGSYPALVSGPSGDGVLAYILFEYLPGEQTNDPGFAVVGPQAVPEPASVGLLAAALAGSAWMRRARRAEPLGHRLLRRAARNEAPVLHRHDIHHARRLDGGPR